MSYTDLKYRPKSGDLVCTFSIKPAMGSVRDAAEHVAGE